MRRKKKEMSAFPVPLVEPNSDGWGPSPSAGLPQQFSSLPFAPFARSDKLGRCADFTANAAWQRANRRYAESSVSNAELQYKVRAFKEVSALDSRLPRSVF